MLLNLLSFAVGGVELMYSRRQKIASGQTLDNESITGFPLIAIPARVGYALGMNTTNDLQLSPCPFCDGAAKFVKHSAGLYGTMGYDRWDAVACQSCGAAVGASDRRFRSKEDAAKVWNKRPTIQPPKAQS